MKKLITLLLLLLVIGSIVYILSTQFSHNESEMPNNDNTSSDSPTTPNPDNSEEPNNNNEENPDQNNDKEEKTPVVNNISSNTTLTSPIHIEGKAPGTWFFEAVMSARLEDQNGNIIKQHYVTATDNWMTTDIISFEGDIEYTLDTQTKAYLILEKSDPSGMREVQSIRIPVNLQPSSTNELEDHSSRAKDGCIISGCSAHICASEEMVSTCEYREEYICYEKAICEKQADDTCGWTMTDTLEACVAQFE